MPTDPADFKYAATYWSYFVKHCEFGGDLRSLVESMKAGQDAGHLSPESYYEATEAGWVQVDTSAIWTALEAEDERRWDEQQGAAQAKPWHVTLHGPEDTTVFQSRHATPEEAHLAAAEYPPLLSPEVTHHD